MREKIVRLYKYDELDETAQAKAREWFAQCVSEDYDADSVLDDAATLAEFFGFDLRQRPTKHGDGSRGWGVSIYYSLYGQGCGASFDGEWRADKCKAGEAVKYAPQDAELAKVAAEFERLALAYPSAVMSASQRRHSTEYSVDIEPPENHDDIARTPQEWTAINSRLMQSTRELKEAAQALAHWIYRRVLSDYEWQTGAEATAEGIQANEYEFTEDGRRDS